MLATTQRKTDAMHVVDYRCTSGPADQPFTEVHDGHTLAYVRKGSFGYHVRGIAHELVAGSLLLGYPADEFMCSHDHVVSLALIDSGSLMGWQSKNTSFSIPLFFNQKVGQALIDVRALSVVYPSGC